MAAFRAELQKAHRRHDLALCLLIPGIVVLWVGGLAPADPEELANGYSALLYSLPVIEAILMPVMMAVLASRLWDMRDQRQYRQSCSTPCRAAAACSQAKRSLACWKCCWSRCWSWPAFRCWGAFMVIPKPFPTGQLCYLFVCTLAVDAMLFFGEFLLMLWVGNPLPALCVGIVGALVGLFFCFYAAACQLLCALWVLHPSERLRSGELGQGHPHVTYGTRPFNWGLLAFTLALGAVLFVLAWRKVQKEEV